MSDLAVFSDTFVAMGSQCDVVLPGVDADFAKKVFQQIKKETEQLEGCISRHSLVSEIWEVNNTPKNEWIGLSGALWELLLICKDLFEMSNSAFDVTVGPLQTLWLEKENPDGDELAERMKQCGFEKIEFDTETKRIRFTEDGMELDFGPIEKGYTLDILKPMLNDMGVKNAIVSFEEDHILALGKHPSGEFWPIGIRNLQKTNEFLHVFPTNDQSISTCGTVYVKDDGEGMRVRTIISPESGSPVEGQNITSVKASSATMGAFIAYIWLILPGSDKEIISSQLENLEIFEAEYLEDDVRSKLDIITGK